MIKIPNFVLFVSFVVNYSSTLNLEQSRPWALGQARRAE